MESVNYTGSGTRTASSGYGRQSGNLTHNITARRVNGQPLLSNANRLGANQMVESIYREKPSKLLQMKYGNSPQAYQY